MWFLHYLADNSSPMTPPMGNYSPVNSNLCDQNVSSTIDGISQDLQAASPMPPAPQQQPPSASQSAASQPSQIDDIPMVEQIGVPIQPNIIDPYRRAGIVSLQITTC